jgi:hypothetical protein
MLLQEFLFKLSFFFMIGFVFGFIQNFFLKITEHIPFKKGVFNVASYFPLSYGVFLPILCCFLGNVYFPIGMVKYNQYSDHFEIDHSSSRFFSYLFLLMIFFFCLQISQYLDQYYFLDIKVVMLIIWFLQVLLVFLLFNLLPIFPMILGGIILKEVNLILLRRNKIKNLVYIKFLPIISVFLFFFVILSINFNMLNYKITVILSFLSGSINSFSLIMIVSFILLAQTFLIYFKKKAYKAYVQEIKELLVKSILKEQDD